MILKIIDRIDHLKISQLTSIESTASGFAIITYTGNLYTLPISRSSAVYKCESERPAQGLSYSIKVEANLKEDIADLAPGIYLIKLDDGSTLIIGTKDFPVKYNSEASLDESSFYFTYKSINKPLIKAN